MSLISDFTGAMEVHDAEAIRKYLSWGIDPNGYAEGKSFFRIMVEMYSRSPAFSSCVKAFADAGLVFDPILLSVLTDDAENLSALISAEPGIVRKPYSLFDAAFTPLKEVTLLHICAEYNQPACAKILVAAGADVDARAGTDAHGFGGHSPLFHTVNQIRNNSLEMMHFLLQNGADPLMNVKGLIWGRTYDWETFIPAVNPLSYAMMGLIPQMHRREGDVAATVSTLMHYAYGMDYSPPNVPNTYLM